MQNMARRAKPGVKVSEQTSLTTESRSSGVSLASSHAVNLKGEVLALTRLSEGRLGGCTLRGSGASLANDKWVRVPL